MAMRAMSLLSIGTIGLLLASGGAGFRLSSPAFKARAAFSREQILNGFGCSGGNTSPALEWTDAPAGTKSYAVTLYDPDAPTGSGWWHWVVFDIPARTKGLVRGAGDPGRHLAPVGSVQSRTDFGHGGYGGPCPPAGDRPHRYIFTVYALDTDRLPLDANASGAMVGFYLHQHTLAKASVTVNYGR